MDDLELARHLVQGAAGLAGELFRSGLRTEYKSAPGDVVSEADRRAEELIRVALARERPADGMLGEEGTSTTGARRWLVDAVDGTLNFLKGDPFWCTAVALEDADGTVVSAVHHAASGETFSAVRGGGCWLGEQALRRTEEVPLSHAVLSTYLHPGDGAREPFQRVLAAVASSRIRGSGSLELAWLAAGRLDVWLQRDVLPWDLAPGSLLVREAGGVTASLPCDDGLWSFACDPSSADQLRGLIADR